MRLASVLLIAIVALCTPAFADDLSKKQLEQVASTYVELFNKQDATALAAMYATGAIIVDQTGGRTNIVQVYQDAFKAGLNRLEISVDQTWPLGSDVGLGMGKFRVSGKNASGAAIEVAGIWTTTYVREGGAWKPRMLTTVPQPPTAK